MEFLNSILAYAGALPDWIVAIMGVFVALNAVTALTPTTADDKVVNFVLKVLNFLSMNIGKNRNADDDSSV